MYKDLPCSFAPFSLFAVLALLSSPLSPLSLFLLVLFFAIHSSYFVEVAHFADFLCKPVAKFVFFLKISFFAEKIIISQIPVIQKSMCFLRKTMILPMSHPRPDDKFGSG